MCDQREINVEIFNLLGGLPVRERGQVLLNKFVYGFSKFAE